MLMTLHQKCSDTDISLDSDVSEVELLEDTNRNLETFKDMDISVDEKVDDIELEECFEDTESPEKVYSSVGRKLI